MCCYLRSSWSAVQESRLLLGELLLREHAQVLELGELLELLHRLRGEAAGPGGRRRRGVRLLRRGRVGLLRRRGAVCLLRLEILEARLLVGLALGTLLA